MASRLLSSSCMLSYAYSLWLFTFSDLKTIVLPSTVFGLANARAVRLYHGDYNHDTASSWTGESMLRLPLVLFWLWIHLLPFTVSNQRDVKSIEEDRINKPWRPLPSGRLSRREAGFIIVTAYTLAQLYSLWLGTGLVQGAILVLLGTWYNNLGGADCNPFVRNLINSLGYTCFLTGALEAAANQPLFFLVLSQSTPFSLAPMASWVAIIAGIVFTTVHSQDMYDQAGDAARQRRTVPLVIGDAPARWMLAVCMVVWGILCPIFWDAATLARVVCAVLAGAVALRSLVLRDVDSDKRTFVVWNSWMAVVYALPLTARS
ncbi:unnamed protein product [Clonostachys rosea]|uniref:Digeranylgeranylglyceryl phosphate synthase n=1 Tax=Bionectria ochroleuca TaxID=29856 RepID=A0ABY6TSE5_BIOOC|nr:unnamed protein product [Clonostachys rosea]